MLRTTELVSGMRNESTDKKSRVSNGPLRQIFAKFLTLIPPFTFTFQAGTDVQYLTEYLTEYLFNIYKVFLYKKREKIGKKEERKKKKQKMKRIIKGLPII